MSQLSLRGQFSQFSGLGTGSGYPDPFHDLASLAVPTQWRSVLYWCLPPGTMVELADFVHRPVELMRPGDRVVTKHGGEHRVKAVSSRPYQGDLVTLQFSGYGNTFTHRMTPDHKVWLYDSVSGHSRRVPAKEVREGDLVATPVPRISADVSPRFSGWLLGLYAAEGCCIKTGNRKLGVRLTLGADDEQSGVLEKAIRSLTEQTGYRAIPYTPPSRPDIRLLTVCDVELPDWCHRHAGELSREKQFSGSVLGYGRDFVLELLAGWLDGDGWATPQGLSLFTASKALAIQCVRLANACGLLPSIREVANDKGFGNEDSIGWQIQFGKTDTEALRPHCVKAALVDRAENKARPRYALESGYAVRKVVGVGSVAYNGLVYNLEVEGDHSYIADGVTTSNCEYIFSMFGSYRMAMERVNSYFTTDIQIENASDDETEKWTKFLNDDLGVITVIQNKQRNRACYGNSFASVLVPFKRFLRCPKCGYMAPLKEVYNNPGAFAFKWQEPEFHASCPACKVGSGYRGAWQVNDESDDEAKNLKVKIWSPHEIELLHHTYNDDVRYLWRIPEEFKQQIHRGDLFHLERTPKEVLKAIHHNQMYMFNPDTIFHMKEPTLAGILVRGWGLPRILYNFRQIWYVQVLRRFNEAIALDYVIPFRIITPAPAQGKAGSSGGAMPIDPLSLYHGGDFRAQVQGMIRRRKYDPAGLQVLPFPVNFQMFGADANHLAPRDLHDQAMETLLNDAGTPIELYNGSLQLQTAPVALRLFESTWHHQIHDSNGFLAWLVRQVSQIMSWEPVTVKLKRVTIADNLEKQMMAAQLMMSQQLSGGTVIGDLGYNWRQEQRRIAEEARFQAELQARTQEEMEQSGFAQQIAKGSAQQAPAQGGGAGGGGGQAAAGGAGGAAGAMGTSMQGPVTAYLSALSPDVPQTPEDMMAVADTIASELLGYPESIKDSELRKLKQQNEALHRMVKGKMEQRRRDVRRDAGNAALGQMQQGGAAA
jgi:hypothetical protein